MKKITPYLKLFYVTAFLILAVEIVQIFTNVNHYHTYPTDTEVAKLFAFFLLLALVCSIALALAFSLLATLPVNRGRFSGFIPALSETLCVLAFALIYVPAFMVMIKGSITPTMSAFWISNHSLMPLALISIVIALRFFLPKVFQKGIYGVIKALWKPLVGITAISAVFLLVCFTIFSTRAKSALPETLSKSSLTEVTNPNIILITFDGLSARDMSLYGYPLKTTPFFETLGKESYVFERAHSNYNKTNTSMVSILTSMYPWTHGVLKLNDKVRTEEKQKNLPALLAGYQTTAIVPIAFSYPPNMGMENQFESVRLYALNIPDSMVALEELFSRITNSRIPAITMPVIRHHLYLNSNQFQRKDIGGKTFDIAAQFIAQDHDRPFFLWLHVWPPHLPYLPPSPFRYKFINEEIDPKYELFYDGYYPPSEQKQVDKTRLRYDEYVLFADTKMKRFVDSVKEAGLFDKTMIIATSDHGELFEKGWIGHNSPTLYEPELHVPLLIHMPGQKRTRRIETLVDHLDIAPTILDLIGRPVPDWMEGEKLTPYMMNDDPLNKKTTVSTVLYTGFQKQNKEQRIFAAYKGNHKLIYNMRSGKTELFNLKTDPGETINIAAKHPDIVMDLKRTILGRAWKFIQKSSKSEK